MKQKANRCNQQIQNKFSFDEKFQAMIENYDSYCLPDYAGLYCNKKKVKCGKINLYRFSALFLKKK